MFEKFVSTDFSLCEMIYMLPYHQAYFRLPVRILAGNTKFEVSIFSIQGFLSVRYDMSPVI